MRQYIFAMNKAAMTMKDQKSAIKASLLDYDSAEFHLTYV